MVEIFLRSSSPQLLHSTSCPPIHRRVSGRKTSVKCSLNLPSKILSNHVLSGLAASLIFISPVNQCVAADLSSHQQNLCQIASVDDNAVSSPFEKDSGENLMMMRGMSANNFDPVRYSGRWFEVASLKRGFAGQGQEDCHCTQAGCVYI
ncbi:hypothetical protein KIW84_020379 [Lathyrus oleraceus]|uniref:Chloroplastic lipocalin n=1 Tax=Pisum sativum TaxID=3888 RepID=A0A9D4Y568_PEA|nr:hypothetical protein KIW84_020379 [Pisum sativum]